MNTPSALYGRKYTVFDALKCTAAVQTSVVDILMGNAIMPLSRRLTHEFWRPKYPFRNQYQWKHFQKSQLRHQAFQNQLFSSRSPNSDPLFKKIPKSIPICTLCSWLRHFRANFWPLRRSHSTAMYLHLVSPPGSVSIGGTLSKREIMKIMFSKKPTFHSIEKHWFWSTFYRFGYRNFAIKLLIPCAQVSKCSPTHSYGVSH